VKKQVQKMAGDMVRLKPWLHRLVAVACLATSALAHGATYPSGPVRLVVPYGPGGSTDIAARLVADKLSAATGQTFIVENKPGAGATLGAAYVARQAPDGYTLVLGTTGHSINQTLMDKLPYNLTRDLTLVSPLVKGALVLVVKQDSPIRSAADLITYIAAHPGATSFGSAGVGSSPQLAVEIMRQTRPFDSIHVPFSGSAADLTALIGGQITFSFETLSAALPFIKSGRVRPLAVSTAQRDAALPEVPTLREQGFKDFDVSFWNGVFVPKQTPPDVVEALNQQIKAALALPDTQAKLAGLSLVPDWRSVADSQRFIVKDVETYAEVIHAAHITIEAK